MIAKSLNEGVREGMMEWSLRLFWVERVGEGMVWL